MQLAIIRKGMVQEFQLTTVVEAVGGEEEEEGGRGVWENEHQFCTVHTYKSLQLSRWACQGTAEVEQRRRKVSSSVCNCIVAVLAMKFLIMIDVCLSSLPAQARCAH